MAKAFGIVNTSGNHIWVEGMQDYRPIGAFSFLGRYRITDFPISNMSNSDIDRIQVFAGANPRSLIEHVGSGRHYNINSKRGKLQILFAESQSKNDIYNTDIAAFWENLDSIQKMKEEYVVITPNHMVYVMNYNKMLKENISVSNIKKTHKLLNQFFKYACKEGYILINPCSNVTLPKPAIESINDIIATKKSKFSYFTEEEISTMYAHAKSINNANEKLRHVSALLHKLTNAPAPDQVYFDLSAGSVEITATTFSGCVFYNGIKVAVTGKHSASTSYHIYQSNNGDVNQTYDGYGVPVYDKSNLSEGICSIGKFNFYVKYNFGHTMDSISFIFNDVMFSGDFIFKNSIGRWDLGGDFSLMQKSIMDLLKSDVNYKIFPGHGDFTYLDDERDMLSKYI